MNREDIIRMAREAGLSFNQSLDEFSTPFCDGVHCENLERFAALVADAAKLEMLMAGHDEWLEEARKAEREACAKVCEEVESRADGLWDKFAYPDDQGMAMGARQCANAIRARSNT